MTGVPREHAERHEENIVHALAMFIEFCNTSEGAVVERAKQSAHDLTAALLAALSELEQARIRNEELEAAMRGVLVSSLIHRAWQIAETALAGSDADGDET